DVAHAEIEVQTEATATRRHGERRDNRNSVATVAVPKLRSVPDGRPRLADVGDEEEAALIHECELGASSRGVFLTGPFIPLPLSAGRLVALERAPLGLLPTPSEAVPQQRPHADLAVADTKPFADDLTNAPKRPQLRGVPGVTSAAEQDGFQLLLLLG